MGLIKKLIDKFQMLERLNFTDGENFVEDFDKKLSKNQKLIKKHMRYIAQDMKILNTYQDIVQYDGEIDVQYENNYNEIKKILDSDQAKQCPMYEAEPEIYEDECERLAVGLSQILCFERYYALYYIYGYRSNEKIERVRVSGRLVLLHDILKFLISKHMIYGRGEYVEWNDETVLTFCNNCTIYDLVKKVYDNMGLVCDFIHALDENDSAKIFEISNKLSGDNVFVEPEEIFEL